MKKILPLIAVVILMANCKKKDDPQTPEPSTPATPAVTTPIANGLPSEATAIDAYLYSGYKRDVSYMSDFNLSMFSVFGTTSRNLMANHNHQTDEPVFAVADLRGNVDLGDVTFSGNAINKSASPTNSQYFTSTVKTSTTATAVWETPKGGRFNALSISIDRGYPQIKVPTEYHIRTNNGIAFKISDLVSNYDSVSFYLSSSQLGAGGFSLEKKYGSNKDSVVFSHNDLAGTYPAYQNLYLSIRAFNYSNKTISNLKYVFELSNKVTNKPFSLGY